MNDITPIVYISGPIGNVDTKYIFRNMGRFFAAEAELLLHNTAPINPAADFIALMMAPNWFYDKADAFWDALWAKDETLVRSSHGLLQLPGWRKSRGAEMEYWWAMEAGIPVSNKVQEIASLAREYAVEVW